MSGIQYNLFFNNIIFEQLSGMLEKVREELIISTANLKDMRLPLTRQWYLLWKETGRSGSRVITGSKQGNRYIPFVEVLHGLRKRGLSVRILASGRSEGVKSRLRERDPADWLRICARNHQKFVLVDNQQGFLTTANLTGCGMGIREDGTRNFESAVSLTSLQVQLMRDEFLKIWTGRYCCSCRFGGKRECRLDAVGTSKKYFHSGQNRYNSVGGRI